MRCQARYSAERSGDASASAFSFFSTSKFLPYIGVPGCWRHDSARRPASIGYLPLPAEAASALFQVVAQRYLKTGIVITTNRSVAEWGEVLGDTTVAAAMLDRLLHRSVVLELDGDSYRLRDHHAPKTNAPPPHQPGGRYSRCRPRVGNFK